jgi:antitoxin component HigA of HigAB toxin-antitoxin module
MVKAIDPYEALQDYVSQFNTQVEAAHALEISTPYLTDLLKRRRTFSDNMLAKLNLTTIVVKESA